MRQCLAASHGKILMPFSELGAFVFHHASSSHVVTCQDGILGPSKAADGVVRKRGVGAVKKPEVDSNELIKLTAWGRPSSLFSTKSTNATDCAAIAPKLLKDRSSPNFWQGARPTCRHVLNQGLLLPHKLSSSRISFFRHPGLLFSDVLRLHGSNFHA